MSTTTGILVFSAKYARGRQLMPVTDGRLETLCTRYETHFFCGTQSFSLQAAGLLSRSRLGGTPGPHVYTTAQMRPPAEVRGACGPPKSRKFTSTHREAIRPARAKQGQRNPKMSPYHILARDGVLLFLHYHTQPTSVLKG